MKADEYGNQKNVPSHTPYFPLNYSEFDFAVLNNHPSMLGP